MRKIIITILCFSGFFSAALAQEKGYFGKKTFIEIGANAQVPLFQNLFGQEKGYMDKGGSLRSSYNLYDQTLRGSFSSSISETSALGFEVMLRNYAIKPQKGDVLNRQYVSTTDGSLVTQEIAARVAMMPVQEVVLMPKITFSSGSIVPAGLTHEIGLGYSLIRLKDVNPLVEMDSVGSLNSTTVSNGFVDDRATELKGLVFNYGLRLNYPISKSILFYIGVRYQYAMMLEKKEYKKYDQTESWFSGQEIWKTLNTRRQLGIANIGLGFTFCF